MKPDQIFEAISYVDEDLLLDSENGKEDIVPADKQESNGSGETSSVSATGRAKIFRWRKWTSLAACACLAVIIFAASWNMGLIGNHSSSSSSSSSATDSIGITTAGLHDESAIDDSINGEAAMAESGMEESAMGESAMEESTAEESAAEAGGSAGSSNKASSAGSSNKASSAESSNKSSSAENGNPESSDGQSSDGGNNKTNTDAASGSAWIICSGTRYEELTEEELTAAGISDLSDTACEKDLGESTGTVEKASDTGLTGTVVYRSKSYENLYLVETENGYRYYKEKASE